jgi:hypothetical protein
MGIVGLKPRLWPKDARGLLVATASFKTPFLAVTALKPETSVCYIQILYIFDGEFLIKYGRKRRGERWGGEWPLFLRGYLGLGAGR